MDPLEEENQPTMRKPNSHFSNMTLTECRNMQRCRSKMFMLLQAYNGTKIKIQFLNTAVTSFVTSYNIPRALTYLLTPMCRVLLEKLTGLQLVKKFPAFLWNPKFHYCTHKRPPPVPILGQHSPVHIPTSHLLEIHPNIHPSTPRSPQWSLSLRFPHQDPICRLSSPIRATCPAHLSVWNTCVFFVFMLGRVTGLGRSGTQGFDFRERERDNVIMGESSFQPHQGFLATWPYFLRFPDRNFVIYTCVTSATCPIPWVSNPWPVDTFVN